MKVRAKLFLSKALKKFEKLYVMVVLFIALLTTASNPVFAAPPKIVTGTVALCTAITTWLLIIIPVAAGAVLGITALQKSLTEDQAIIAEKNKMMKNVLIGAAIAETASGLVVLFLSFFD